MALEAATEFPPKPFRALNGSKPTYYYKCIPLDASNADSPPFATSEPCQHEKHGRTKTKGSAIDLQ